VRFLWRYSGEDGLSKTMGKFSNDSSKIAY